MKDFKNLKNICKVFFEPSLKSDCTNNFVVLPKIFLEIIISYYITTQYKIKSTNYKKKVHLYYKYHRYLFNGRYSESWWPCDGELHFDKKTKTWTRIEHPLKIWWKEWNNVEKKKFFIDSQYFKFVSKTKKSHPNRRTTTEYLKLVL